MQETLLIGFGLKARSGKDTAVKAIVEAYRDKYDVRRYALADELKLEVAEIDQVEYCLRHGIEYDFSPDMTDPLCQTRHGKQSHLLQHYGTEYRRASDPFYWVNKLRKRIAEEKPQIALISDMRFKNEYFWIKAFGGFTVKVTRHGYVDLSRSATHASETELEGTLFDYEITCMDGEVEQLKHDARTVFEMIIEQVTPKMPDLPNLVVQGVQ
jgi:hypothetical protein